MVPGARPVLVLVGPPASPGLLLRKDNLLFEPFQPVLPETRAVPRQCFLMLTLTATVFEVLAYNTHPGFFESLCASITTALQWANFRDHFLLSLTHAKMGLFYHVPPVQMPLNADCPVPNRCQTLPELKLLVDTPLLPPQQALKGLVRPKAQQQQQQHTGVLESMKGHRPHTLMHTAPFNTEQDAIR